MVELVLEPAELLLISTHHTAFDTEGIPITRNRMKIHTLWQGHQEEKDKQVQQHQDCKRPVIKTKIIQWKTISKQIAINKAAELGSGLKSKIGLETCT